MPPPRRLPFLACLLLATAAAAQAPVLAGRVLTDDGAPAAHATLQLRWRMAPELPGLCGISLGDRGLGELAGSADADGRFKLELPHRGPFELCATTADACSLAAFPVMAGGYRELRLGAPFAIGGRVVDADEQPVAHTAVQLVPELTAWSKLAAYRLPEARGRTATNADGRFALPFPTDYLQRDVWQPFVLVDVDRDGVACSRCELLRPTGHCRDLQLQLVAKDKAHPRAPRARPLPTLPPGSVSLRARLTADGRPLAQAPVLLSQLGRDGAPHELALRTDADGVVAASDLPPLVTLGFVQADGLWLPFCRLAVQGQDIDLQDVAVQRRQVNGQVVDANGQPLAGARVAALAKAALPGELPHVTYSDHGGRFRFASLPTGGLRLWADCGVHGFAAASLADGGGEATLRPPLEGTVDVATLDGEGRPLPRAWLVLVLAGNDPERMPGLRPGQLHHCVHTGDDGTVHLTGLPAGHWQVIGNAIADGRLFGGGGEVDTGGALELTLRLVRE